MLCGLAGMAYYSAPTVAHSGLNGRSADEAYYQPVRPEDLDFLPPDEAFESSVDYMAMDAEIESADDDEAGDEENIVETTGDNTCHPNLNEDQVTEIIEE